MLAELQYQMLIGNESDLLRLFDQVIRVRPHLIISVDA